MKNLLICIVCGVLLTGCAPKVRVTKNPTDCDQGIRYYRPKPYLFVTASGQSTTTGSGSSTRTTVVPSDQFVSIQLQYLPDFSEEYAISVRPGLGTADVEIGLEDGWNLTSINQNLDSNFDENVGAIADLVGSVGGLVGTSSGLNPATSRKSVEVANRIAARNVPLGYYEAVVGRDDCGKKQLYGWRYLGFVPFASCPIRTCGSESTHCSENSNLFGLVFENGVMTFKQLTSISYIQDATYVAPSVEQPSMPSMSSAGQQIDAELPSRLQQFLRNELQDQNLTVSYEGFGDGNRLEIFTDLPSTTVIQAVAEFPETLERRPIVNPLSRQPQIPVEENMGSSQR